MRVELVGGFGSGKTTLCEAFEIIGFNCIYAQTANPIIEGLADFHFPAQMQAVLNKFQDIHRQERPDLINIIDSGLFNLRVQSRVLMRKGEREGLHVLNQCIDYMETRLGRPELLVYLKCSPQAQMSRIQDKQLDEVVALGYIAEMQREMTIALQQARGEGRLVLTIDTDAIYLPGNMAFAEQLARQIADIVYRPSEGQAVPENTDRPPANDQSPLMQYIEMAEAI